MKIVVIERHGLIGSKRPSLFCASAATRYVAGAPEKRGQHHHRRATKRSWPARSGGRPRRFASFEDKAVLEFFETSRAPPSPGGGRSGVPT